MSRATAHLHRLIGLCLVAAAFALTATVAISAASAGQGTKLDPPSLLWKSYPLDRQPSTTEQQEQIRRRQASRQTSARQDHFLTPVLVSAFILLLAAAAIVLMRRSAPVRVGNRRRTPDRAPMARSVQPASVDRAGWGPRRRLQLREVIPEVVKEPHTPAPHATTSQSDADLLEALRPKPNPPRPEPTTDVPVVDVEEAYPGRTPEPVDQGPAKQPPRRETGDLLVEEREAPEAVTEALDHLLGVLDFRSDRLRMGRVSFDPGSVRPAAVPDEAAGAYVRAFARHRLLVAVVTGFAVGAALYWSSGRARTYESSASILVSPVPEGDSTFIGTGVVVDTLDPARTVQTAAALLDTQNAAAAAATAMGTGWTARRVRGAVSVTPRGGSNVLAVTASAPTAAQAARLANIFARSAVADRATIVQHNVAAQVGVLQRRLSQLPQAALTSSQGVDLSARIAQLRAVQDTGRDPTLSVSQPAQLPGQPTGAPTWLIIALAAIAGLAIGSVAALVVDFLQPQVRDESEVVSLFPAPILATIPKVSRFHRHGRLTPLSLPPAAFEQVRLLRTQIPRRRQTPVVMITSSDVGDGKTTVATALAAALAETEQDVVLLDLDLRSPAVAKVFELEQPLEKPAHEYTTLRESLVPVPKFPHLKILPARKGDISALESLIGRLPGLLIEAERLAKWVILDTPPLGEVSDALRLAGECEPIVVMVVRLRHTDRSKLALARDLLTRVKATTVGTVLVGQQAATLRGSYYGYRYAQASNTRRPRIPKRRPSPPDAAPVSDSGD